jgi:hypothetical protein
MYNEKLIGVVDDVSKSGYDIYFEIDTEVVKARDKDGTDHILFTAKEENDVLNVKLAYEQIKNSGWM